MFSGCTSLTQAPELPATTLAGDCYESMFSGCTSLTQAPALPATTLAIDCYEDMFSGCINLSELNVSFDDWNSGNVRYSCSGWVKDVAPTGTFICPKNLIPAYGISRIPIGWTVKSIVDGDTVDVPIDYNYLTFTAEEDGSTFGIETKKYRYSSIESTLVYPSVQYSLDGGVTWTALVEGDTILLAHKGDKALLRGDNPNGFSEGSSYSTFKMTGKVAASGSVMSLIDGIGCSVKIPQFFCCFSGLFENCTSLTQAPALPATTLSNECYAEMFSGCTSLTQAPELPATTLDEHCYAEMFYGCTSLTQAPALPATTLADACYKGMFKGCTGLTQAPELPATTLARYCYFYMFENCTSLTQAPELPATTLAVYCYMSMFSGCTSLTQAPELPATTLADHCCQYMFEGCTSLTQAPELPATELVFACYESMFEGCTSLTQAPKLPATTLAGACYFGMFSSCTSLTQAPALPATTLADDCYEGMFKGCTGLTQAPELPATTLVSACYQYMFSGCTSLTQAPELPAPELIAHSNVEFSCYLGMFSECTNLSEISVAFVKWKDSTDRWEDNTYRWVENVAPTGTFICPKALALEYGEDRIPEGWTVKYIEDGSGVNTTLADNISVWSDDLTVYVRGAKGEVSIYDLSGKRVAVSYSADEERALSVASKGVYVVRTNNGTSDVLVR